MATKTLEVKQLIAAGDVLYARVDDGSVWSFANGEWTELPAIEVDEESNEES